MDYMNGAHPMSEDSSAQTTKLTGPRRRLERNTTRRFECSPEHELNPYQSFHKHNADDTTSRASKGRDRLDEFYSEHSAWLTHAAFPSVGSAIDEDEFHHSYRYGSAYHPDPLVPEPLNLDRSGDKIKSLDDDDEDNYHAGDDETIAHNSSSRYRRVVDRSEQSSEQAISPLTTIPAFNFSNFSDPWTTTSNNGAEENVTYYCTPLSQVSPRFPNSDQRSPNRTNPVSTAHPVQFISTPRIKKPVNSRRLRQSEHLSSTGVPAGKANGSKNRARGRRRISVYTPSKVLPNGELHASHYGKNYPSAQQLEAWRRMYPGRGEDTGLGRDLYGWTCTNVTFDDICSWSQLARAKPAWYRRPLKYF